MWTRLCVLVAVGTLALLPEANRERLIERYGAPTVDAHDKPGSDTFLVRSEMEASVQYGTSGRVCSIVLRPLHAARPLNSTENSIAPKELSEVLDELVPQAERGARRASSPLHTPCGSFQFELECSGIEQDWEKLVIHRNGGNKSEQCATIRWKRDECNFVRHPDFGCALEDAPNAPTR